MLSGKTSVGSDINLRNFLFILISSFQRYLSLHQEEDRNIYSLKFKNPNNLAEYLAHDRYSIITCFPYFQSPF